MLIKCKNNASCQTNKDIQLVDKVDSQTRRLFRRQLLRDASLVQLLETTDGVGPGSLEGACVVCDVDYDCTHSNGNLLLKWTLPSDNDQINN